MKKLNSYFKIIILTTAFFISSNNIYSQWIIAGDLSGVEGSRPQVSVVDGNTAFVTGGSSVNATYKTINGGISWTQLNTGAFQVFYAICAKDAVNVFAGDNGGGGAIRFFKSTNGGSTWTIIDSISVAGASTSNFKQIRFSISIPNFGIAYAEGDNAVLYIYKTRDGGNTWTRTLGPTYPGYVATGGINVIDSLFFAYGLNGSPPAIVITTDGGITWNLREINLPSIGFDITRGLAFKEDKLTAIASSNSTSIISRTTNGGSNWVNIDVGNNIANALASVMNWIDGTNICYMTATTSTTGTINGILKSTNGGLNWSSMTTSGLGANYVDTKRIGSNIYGYANSAVPGAFGGNLVLKVTDMIVGINQISELVPDVYHLSQNYPNPFNPTTKIKFDLLSNVKSQTSDVKLNIYNSLGKDVERLVNENLQAGSYEVSFDGSNYSSGVYFYKLTVDGNVIDTKRMVLLK